MTIAQEWTIEQLKKDNSHIEIQHVTQKKQVARLTINGNTQSINILTVIKLMGLGMLRLSKSIPVPGSPRRPIGIYTLTPKGLKYN